MSTAALALAATIELLSPYLNASRHDDEMLAQEVGDVVAEWGRVLGDKVLTDRETLTMGELQAGLRILSDARVDDGSERGVRRLAYGLIADHLKRAGYEAGGISPRGFGRTWITMATHLDKVGMAGEVGSDCYDLKLSARDARLGV